MIVVAVGALLCSLAVIAWKLMAYLNAWVTRGACASRGVRLADRAPHWRLFSRTLSPWLLTVLIVSEDPHRAGIEMDEISAPRFRASSAALNPRRRYYAAVSRSCRALLADHRRAFLSESARSLHISVVFAAVGECLSRPNSHIREGGHVDVFIAVKDAEHQSAAPVALMKVPRV